MSLTNKQILVNANEAVTKGNYEEFLRHCTEDTHWNFMGDQILRGKEAVRQYMAEIYTEPPVFMVENIIAEGDFVTVLGKISLKDKNGKTTDYDYCDVWEFKESKMAALKAFVIPV